MTRTDRVGSSLQAGRHDRLLQGTVATALLAAAVLRVGGGPLWASLVVAMVGLLAAAARMLVLDRQFAAEDAEAWRDLLFADIERIDQIAARHGFYDLGVESEAPDALASAGAFESGHAPYIPRAVDDALNARLTDPTATGRATFVVLSGPSKAGKSRTLAEAVSRALPDGWLIAPRDVGALVRLTRERPPVRLKGRTVVVWLNDLERWVQGAEGHTGLSDAIRDLGRRTGKVVVVATSGGKGQQFAEKFEEGLDDLLRRYPPLRLRSVFNDDEEAAFLASPAYAQAAKPSIVASGIGEFMIAAPRLISRLEDTQDAPDGIAVARAAIDWRRAGIVGPADKSTLRRLFDAYRSGEPTDDGFAQGFEWATTPIYARVALVVPEDGGWEPYDFIVRHVEDTAAWRVPDAAWNVVIDSAAPEQLVEVGFSAQRYGRADLAKHAWRRAGSAGVGRAELQLGLLFSNEDDTSEAERAFTRGDALGSADAALFLGGIYAGRDDTEQALAAWQRALARGNGTAAMGVASILYHHHRDLEGARRAAEQGMSLGDPEAASMLGSLLSEAGDTEGSMNAYRWADEHGHAFAAVIVGASAEDRDELDRARAAFERARDRESPEGALRLGELLEKQGRFDEAEVAFRLALTTSGDSRVYELRDFARRYASFLKRRGRFADALEALRELDEQGDPDAALAVAQIHAENGNLEAAETAFRRARDRGHLDAQSGLGAVLAKRKETARAIAELRQADRRGSGHAAYNLGVVLADDGQLDAAEAALRRALRRGYTDPARGTLVLLLMRRGSLDEAKRQAELLVDTKEDGAQFLLGFVLEARGETEPAIAAYRSADLTEDGIDLSQLSVALCHARADALEAAIEPLRQAIPAALLGERARLLSRPRRRRDEGRFQHVATPRPEIAALLDQRFRLLADDGSGALALGHLLAGRGELGDARRAYEACLGSPVVPLRGFAVIELLSLPPDVGLVRALERLGRRWAAARRLIRIPADGPPPAGRAPADRCVARDGPCGARSRHAGPRSGGGRTG